MIWYLLDWSLSRLRPTAWSSLPRSSQAATSRCAVKPRSPPRRSIWALTINLASNQASQEPKIRLTPHLKAGRHRNTQQAMLKSWRRLRSRELSNWSRSRNWRRRLWLVWETTLMPSCSRCITKWICWTEKLVPFSSELRRHLKESRQWKEQGHYPTSLGPLACSPRWPVDWSHSMRMILQVFCLRIFSLRQCKISRR